MAIIPQLVRITVPAGQAILVDLGRPGTQVERIQVTSTVQITGGTEVLGRFTLEITPVQAAHYEHEEKLRAVAEENRDYPEPTQARYR